MKIDESFYLGYFIKTKGLKGELQFFFEFKDYHFLNLDVLFIDINGKLVPFFVSAFKLQPNHTGLFCLDDVDHIDKAQTLVKKKVYLPLNKMPDIENQEFTYLHLKNYTVSDQHFGLLGVITEVNKYSQQFVASLLYKGEEILFPLNQDFIIQIDKKEKTLFINLPDGLLNVYLEQ